MKTIRYHKLVRDSIPDIIKAAGKDCTTDILPEEKYIAMLNEKLDEEVNEYHSDPNAEELADIIEVVYALAEASGISREQLETLRNEKAEKNGAFEKRILLTEVYEP